MPARPAKRIGASGRKLGFAARLAGLAALILSLPGATVAENDMASLSVENAASFVAQPLTSGTSAAPVVMLGLSIDEQLYGRAYDDSSDLDGDGLLDTGYRNSLDYTGYFDPALCYAYGESRFKAVAAAGGEYRHQCLSAASGSWSGNFLNWLSMSRLDLLRAALYGGRRSTDSLSMTVLERSHVPADFHAWAKFYDGADANLYTPFAQDAATPGLSFCNVSFTAGGDADSATSAAAPLLRAARGNFRLWAAAESRECLWNEESASTDQPARALAGLGDGDYQVRIEVCDATAPAALRESFCRQYPNGLKPAGQLQRYGEDGQLQFGLLSGSYAKPRSGGQLRRNAAPLAGNGNGQCASGDEINLASGQFCSGAGGAAGIVNTIDRLRIARYRSADGVAGYSDCPGDTGNRGGIHSLDSPGGGSSACNGWGNPLAEIHAEILRYLSGEAAATTAFTGNDSAILPGLPSATWQDAYAHTEHCAECSVVMLASGVNSFDSDEIPPVPALGGAIAAAATDAIGDHESLSGPALLGRVGLTPAGSGLPTGADHCAVRTLGGLSQARGICPDSPAREGSYLIAGLAYRAWTGDLRPDGGAASAGQQRARSYGLQFGGRLPVIPVSTSAGTLTITPACEASPLPAAPLDDSQWRSCSYGSMTPGAIRSPAGQEYGRPLAADGRAGSFLIAWSDETYGGSQQRKLLQMLSWCVGASCALDRQPPAGPDICAGSDSTALCTSDGRLARSIGDDEVLVRTELIAAGNADSSLIGYTVTGALAGNGAQRLVRRQRGDDGSLLATAVPDASQRWSRPKLLSFMPGPGPGRVLESPLFYAAKYGSFDYNSGTPAGGSAPLPSPGTTAIRCSDSAWDHLDNASDAAGADCIPDNYFALGNPARLRDRLGAVFGSILKRGGSGAGTAVLAGAAAGPGAFYQTSYNISRSDGAGRRLSWVGNLQALFVDRDGRLREDGNGNARLDEADYSASGDPVVELYYDAEQRISRFRRYSANPAISPDAFTVLDDLSSLRTIWDARRALSAVSDVTTQRAYSAPASSGRYLFTFADFNLDGRAQAGEQLPLTPASFGAGRYGLLNVGSAAAAEKLIRYTRGEEFASLRNRTVDDDGDGRAEVLRLGDIVNSVPLAVAAPAESYDLIYGDRTYAAFFNRYRGRRNVIYVGANDGLLHAFNGGFLEPASQRFLTTPSGDGSVAAHPLGSELWAYAPFNLLPQLGWLADPRYGHLWTMDGSPRAFDVRAFADDATHPNGWGTVLVVGMRLGGGPVTIPAVDADGRNRVAVGDFAAGLGDSTTLTTRSAFVVLDVTDPEQPPVLIAEYSDRNGRLGYTTSAPAIAAFARRNASTAAPPAEDRWYLTFGSGPTSLSSASSNQNGFLFGIDLKRLIASPVAVADTLIYGGPYDLGGGGSGAPLSFVGDPVAVDWDLNFRADALYFGTAGNRPSAPAGKLFKLDFNLAASVDGEGNDSSGWRTPAALLDTQRPILAAPSLTQDRSGRRWVLSGTGRFLAPGDKTSSAAQSLFGFIDNTPAAAAPVFGALVDTSSAVVAPSGAVSGVAGASTELELVDTVAAAGGWRYALATAPDSAAERSVNRTALIDGLLFASSYSPSASLCSGDGGSRLFAFNFQTGAPRAQRPAFGMRRVTVSDTEIDSSAGVLDLGPGLGTPPLLHIDSGSNGLAVVTVNVQTARGSVVQQDVRVSSGTLSGEIDWRQTHRNP